MSENLRDYYAAATVRFKRDLPNNVLRETGHPWTLWMERIQAPSLTIARMEAVRLIGEDREYAHLQIMWDTCLAHVVVRS